MLAAAILSYTCLGTFAALALAVGVPTALVHYFVPRPTDFDKEDSE